MQASKNEALLAIDLYNRSGEARQLEAFIVHMSMAWLRLLQAHAEKNGEDLYVRAKNGNRIRHQDGGWKMKPLSDLVSTYFAEKDPCRVDLEFFTGLRNIIEHRYERDIASLVAGRTQAYVLNYEQTLVQWFGATEGMARQLRFPMFVSSITEDAMAAVKEVRSRVPGAVLEWVQDFDATLDSEVATDQSFDFRVYLVPHTGPKTEADAAMTFVKLEDLNDHQKAAMHQVQTIIRDKQVPVANLNLMKPSAVVPLVATRLGKPFSMNTHTNAWKHYGVRPNSGAERPEATRSQFCVWDTTFRQYVYTEAWVEYLVRHLSKDDEYRTVFGRASGYKPGM